jgi:D-alanyl-D-alanine dipeptidase
VATVNVKMDDLGINFEDDNGDELVILCSRFDDFDDLSHFNEKSILYEMEQIEKRTLETMNALM